MGVIGLFGFRIQRIWGFRVLGLNSVLDRTRQTFAKPESVFSQFRV